MTAHSSRGLLPVVVVLTAAGCGSAGDVSDPVDPPTTFACRTWSLHHDPLRDARGVPTPQQAAAPYLPDGAAVVTDPEDPAGGRDVTFLAYVDGELVARVETANLTRGHGWWALSVRSCG